MSRTLGRAQAVAFSEPYVDLHRALLANRLALARYAPDRLLVPAIQNFNSRLGSSKSSYEAYALDSFPHATLVRFPTWDGVVRAVREGTVIAGFRDELEVNRILDGDPSASLTLRSIVFSDSSDAIAIAIPWSNSQTRLFVDVFLQEPSTHEPTGGRDPLLLPAKLGEDVMSLTRIMRHPLAIVSGIGIGIAVGVWSPAVTPAMRAIGDGYLLLFKMCVAPILISLITAAIARITGLPESARLVRRIAIVFPIAMVLVSAFGALVGVVTGPGRSLTAAARSSLGVVLGAQQNTFTMPLFSTAASDDAPPGAVAFFHTIVPANVFAALSSDAALQIIFVAVIFGASLG